LVKCTDGNDQHGAYPLRREKEKPKTEGKENKGTRNGVEEKSTAMHQLIREIPVGRKAMARPEGEEFS